MSRKTKVTSTVVDEFYTRVQSGETICNICNSLNISDKTAYALKRAIELHGLDKIKNNPSIVIIGTLEKTKLSRIIEFQLACNIPTELTSILFMIPRGQLDKVLNERKLLGRAVCFSGVAVLPSDVNEEAFARMLNKYSPGKTWQELRQEHMNKCTLNVEDYVESDATQDIEKVLVKAKPLLSDIDLENFQFTGDTTEDIIALWQIGARPNHLVKLYKIPAATASRTLTFLEYHGAEELRRLPTLTEPGGFEDKDIAAIVEFAIAYNLPSSQVSLIFKCTENRINKKRKLRATLGYPISNKIAALPKSINMDFLRKQIKRYNGELTMEQLNALYKYNLKYCTWDRYDLLFEDNAYRMIDCYQAFKSSQEGTAEEPIVAPTIEDSNKDSVESPAPNINESIQAKSNTKLEVITSKAPQASLRPSVISEAVSRAVGLASSYDADKDRDDDSSNSTSPIKPKQIFVGTSQDNRTTRDSLPKPIMGRARAPIPKKSKSKDVRNKDLVNNSRQQKLINAHEQGIDISTLDQSSKPRQDVKLSIKSKYTSYRDLAPGIDAKDYSRPKGKAGRDPRINIKSEGFDQLPLEVQLQQLKRYIKEVESLWDADVKKKK